VLDAITSSELVIPSQRFRYAVARARLARASGEDGEARRYAEDALREAARKPRVGRSVEADPKVLCEMQQLAHG
jgi:hypothetical protein